MGVPPQTLLWYCRVPCGCYWDWLQDLTCTCLASISWTLRKSLIHVDVGGVSSKPWHLFGDICLLGKTKVLLVLSQHQATHGLLSLLCPRPGLQWPCCVTAHWLPECRWRKWPSIWALSLSMSPSWHWARLCCLMYIPVLREELSRLETVGPV